MNEWSMRSRWTWWTCIFKNKWACQASQHESKEQHAKASSSKPRTIKDSVHFAMQRWSYDTPWRHRSLSNTLAQHALQQQIECTNIVMSSHVESSHESCYPHLHYGVVVNQCDLTCNSKRVVEQPQGLVSPLAINTPSFVYERTFHLISSHIAKRVCNILFEE